MVSSRIQLDELGGRSVRRRVTRRALLPFRPASDARASGLPLGATPPAGGDCHLFCGERAEASFMSIFCVLLSGLGPNTWLLIISLSSWPENATGKQGSLAVWGPGPALSGHPEHPPRGGHTHRTALPARSPQRELPSV